MRHSLSSKAALAGLTVTLFAIPSVASCSSSSSPASKSEGGSSRSAGSSAGGESVGKYGYKKVWAEPDKDIRKDFDNLQLDHPLVIATDVSIGLPLTNLTKDGEMEGVATDLSVAIAQTMGANFKIENISFDSLLPGVAAGRYDVVASGMGATKDRQKQADFLTYIVGGSRFAVGLQSSETNLTPDKTCGMTIGAARGSIEEQLMAQQATKCKEEGKQQIHVEVFPNKEVAYLALAAGRVDAVLADYPNVTKQASKSNPTLKASGELLKTVNGSLAFPKSSPLVKIAQKALQNLIDDGTYTKILNKYGQQKMAVKTTQLNHKGGLFNAG